MLCDIGISYGQGYFLARPALQPREEIDADARAILLARRVAVLPELGKMSRGGHWLRVRCHGKNPRRVTPPGLDASQQRLTMAAQVCAR